MTFNFPWDIEMMAIPGIIPVPKWLKIKRRSDAGCRLCTRAREHLGADTEKVPGETFKYINNAICDGMVELKFLFFCQKRDCIHFWSDYLHLILSKKIVTLQQFWICLKLVQKFDVIIKVGALWKTDLVSGKHSQLWSSSFSLENLSLVRYRNFEMLVVCTSYKCFWHQCAYLRHNRCRMFTCARVFTVCLFTLGYEGGGV